jgi:hypothetical protein
MDTTSTAGTRASETAEAVTEQARETASTAAEGAVAVAERAKTEAGEVAGAARSQARELVGSARDELRAQSDQQVQRVTDGLRRVSDELRSMAAQGDGDTPVRGLVQEAGDRVGSWADRLDRGGLDAALHDLSSYARRRPGTFLLGAMAGGFLAGRTLRTVQQVVGDASSQPSSTGPATAVPGQTGALGTTGGLGAAGGLGTTEPVTALPSPGPVVLGTEPAPPASGIPAV